MLLSLDWIVVPHPQDWGYGTRDTWMSSEFQLQASQLLYTILHIWAWQEVTDSLETFGKVFGNLCINTFLKHPYKSQTCCIVNTQFSTWRDCSKFSFSIRTALVLYRTEYTYIILPWKVWKIQDSSKDNFRAVKPCSELRKLKAKL